MAVARKFLFDLSFDPPPPDEAPQEPEAPPPVTAPTFTPEEIEAARSAAFEEGRRAALAEAAAAREAEVAATLASISARIAVLVAELAAVREDAERSAVELAMAVARKFVPALARRVALDEVMTLVKECLREAMHEPRVVVRVPDDLFEATRDRLDGLAAATAFAGKIMVLADETLESADCRIEWADGGAERDEARLWREIDAAVERALSLRSTALTPSAGKTPAGDVQ